MTCYYWPLPCPNQDGFLWQMFPRVWITPSLEFSQEECGGRGEKDLALWTKKKTRRKIDNCGGGLSLVQMGNTVKW